MFINYRGEDSHSYGALLYTELARQFGERWVFLDCESIPAGADFADELLGRARSARVLLAVIGPTWLTATDPTGHRCLDDPGDWIRRELATALAAGVRVIPILTDQAELPREADLPTEIAALSRCQYRYLRRREPTVDLARIVADLTALEPAFAAAVHRGPDASSPAAATGGVQDILYVDGVRGQRRAVSGALVRECPYPGLAAFGPEQARWFFGRDELIAELTTRLDQRLHTGGVQVVLAPSGAGKSSLLRAGLLPKLDQAALPGSDRWPKVVFTPTADPVWVLAANIALLTGVDVAVVVEELVGDPSGCLSRLSYALRERVGDRDPHPRWVVVVDQFEQLFTLCVDGQQRRTFIDVLTRIAGHRTDGGAGRDPVGLVMVGVRADFYPACVDHPLLRAALQDAPLVVGSMSEAELREAILFPARDVGLDVEPGLVEVLLRDLGATALADAGGDASYEAGRLPLLAHVLRVSWQQRHGQMLTMAGYRATGVIRRAVATTAEQLFTRFTPPAQHAARRMFLRLVTRGGQSDRSA